MMALLQRVCQARVEVAGTVVGEIGPGLLALVCAEQGDGEAEADKLRRDAFISAAEAYNEADALVAKSGEFRLSEIEKITRAEEDAVAAYLDLAYVAQTSDEQIAADMQVHLVNDGPVTIPLRVAPMLTK